MRPLPFAISITSERMRGDFHGIATQFPVERCIVCALSIELQGGKTLF